MSQRWKPFSGTNSLSETWNNLFRDHEIFIRTAGHVRFLRLSASLQRRAATVVLAVVLTWLMATIALLGWQAWTSWKTRDIAARAVAVDYAEARVAAERQTVEGIADTLDARQDSIEALFMAHFGDDPEADAALATDKKGPASSANGPPQPAAPAATGGAGPATVATASASIAQASTAQASTAQASTAQAAPKAAPKDQVGRLQAMAARQDRLVQLMTEAVVRRVGRAEAALLTVGLRPTGNAAQGGPFEPYRDISGFVVRDPALLRLADKLGRMEQLEALLVALPSDMPTDDMQLSSGFGYRFDPFNGQRAMHSGLDFKGPHGTPIRTAAAGRVSFAGVMSGYGNVIDVDHGHGIMTRYAHLAGFTVREGQVVTPGQQIARMGSTGRSTGTHLHFEVRVNGVAVNPRRFLEANPDVLEVKADAGSRVRSLAAS